MILKYRTGQLTLSLKVLADTRDGNLYTTIGGDSTIVWMAENRNIFLKCM